MTWGIITYQMVSYQMVSYRLVSCGAGCESRMTGAFLLHGKLPAMNIAIEDAAQGTVWRR